MAHNQTMKLAIPIKSPLRILLLTTLTSLCIYQSGRSANPAHSPIPISISNSLPLCRSRCNLSLNLNFRQTLTPSS